MLRWGQSVQYAPTQLLTFVYLSYFDEFVEASGGGSMTGGLRGGHQWRRTTGGGLRVVGGEDGGSGAAHRVVGDPLWAVLAAGSVIGGVRKGGMARWGRDVSGAETRCRRPRAVVEAAVGGGAANE
jgi:hypothetical protein